MTRERERTAYEILIDYADSEDVEFAVDLFESIADPDSELFTVSVNVVYTYSLPGATPSDALEIAYHAAATRDETFLTDMSIEEGWIW